MCYVPRTPPIFILYSEIDLLLDLVPLKDRKASLENVDCHACQAMVFKNSNYQWFIPVLKESNPSLSQSHPQLNAQGALNIETIFHISFHQHQGRCPAYHFLIMWIGRNLHHLRRSSVWQREPARLMGQLHKAKKRVLLVYLTSKLSTIRETETYKNVRWDWSNFGSVFLIWSCIFMSSMVQWHVRSWSECNSSLN